MITKPTTTQLITVILLLAGTAVFVGCNQQGRGFALPEGDIEAGKMAFTKFGCNECHQVADINWVGDDESLRVPLGGEVSNLKTYGELVTSIINPSHKVAKKYEDMEVATPEGKSKMTTYNEVMFVDELIDIVTFLQAEYEVETPPSYYSPYSE